MTASVAQIGHNKPPKTFSSLASKTAFEAIEANVSDLFDEAVQWLDGDPVTTQQQADALNTLEKYIRDAAKAAEEQRKAEAKPFDDGKAAVQAKYKPLKLKTDEAIGAVKSALKPYLLELDRIQREAAEKARAEAERKQREAMESMQKRDDANLEQRMEAERLVAEAKAAQSAADRAGKAKAHAKGEGRASGLRSVWVAEMTDKRAAVIWAMNAHSDEILAFTQDLADKAVRAGSRSIPGFNVREDRRL